MPRNCTRQNLEDISDSFGIFQRGYSVWSICLCSFGILATTIAIKLCKIKFLGKNLQNLMYFHHCSTYVYSIFFIITQSYHLLSRLFYDECDLLVAVKYCGLLRIPQSVTSTFFIFFFMAITINNLCTRLFHSYSESGHSVFLGYIALFVSMAGTVPSIFIDFHSEDYMMNCSSFEHKSAAVQQKISLYLLVFNVIAFSAFVALSVSLRLEKENPVDRLAVNRFVVRKDLQMMWRLVGPSLGVNFVFNSLYAGLLHSLAAADRLSGNNYLFANTTPYYVAVSPILWMISLKQRETRIKTQPLISAKNFNQRLGNSWNEELRNRGSRTIRCCQWVMSCFVCKKSEPVQDTIEAFHALDEQPNRRRSQTERDQETMNQGCCYIFGCFRSGPQVIKVKPMNGAIDAEDGRIKKMWKGIKKFFKALFSCKKLGTAQVETSSSHVTRNQPATRRPSNHPALQRATIAMT